MPFWHRKARPPHDHPVLPGKGWRPAFFAYLRGEEGRELTAEARRTPRPSFKNLGVLIASAVSSFRLRLRRAVFLGEGGTRAEACDKYLIRKTAHFEAPTLLCCEVSMSTMKTKRTPLLTILMLIALPLITDAQSRRTGRSSGASVDSDRPVTNCGDIRVTYDRRPAITGETEMTLPPSQVSNLQAQMSNGGIYLSGWDRNEYSVKTCKAVPADDPNASSTLGEITTTNANGRISVSGPNGREWMANLIIRAPRLSSLALQTQNGPLQLRDLAGNIQLSASNGPISLD